MSADIKPAGEQSGFTLIEVMVAMIILSIGLMTVAAGFLDVLRVAALAPVHLAAKEIAAAEIDSLTMRSESGMINVATMGPQNSTRMNCLKGREGSGDPQDCYQFFVRTEFSNDMSNPGLFRAEITVSYMAGGAMRQYVKTVAL